MIVKKRIYCKEIFALYDRYTKQVKHTHFRRSDKLQQILEYKTYHSIYNINSYYIYSNCKLNLSITLLQLNVRANRKNNALIQLPNDLNE